MPSLPPPPALATSGKNNLAFPCCSTHSWAFRNNLDTHAPLSILRDPLSPWLSFSLLRLAKSWSLSRLAWAVSPGCRNRPNTSVCLPSLLYILKRPQLTPVLTVYNSIFQTIFSLNCDTIHEILWCTETLNYMEVVSCTFEHMKIT